jgi:hypothetical protein
MTVASTADLNLPLKTALRSCIRTMQRLANYSLPPALDRRMLELGERKEFLDPNEHDELLALVAFTHERSAEKLQAELALRQLHGAFPGEFPS